jgi:hypothetical protein
MFTFEVKREEDDSTMNRTQRGASFSKNCPVSVTCVHDMCRRFFPMRSYGCATQCRLSSCCSRRDMLPWYSSLFTRILAVCLLIYWHLDLEHELYWLLQGTRDVIFELCHCGTGTKFTMAKFSFIEAEERKKQIMGWALLQTAFCECPPRFIPGCVSPPHFTRRVLTDSLMWLDSKACLQVESASC